ncbi:tetratricopeptide repeat protein [Melittangium boletus]|uniref:tetratricopeptide repeat protein n=1 Tax=Melittangium boletus TaxID=83453 RepID=UPI003DA5B2A9
MAEKSEKMTTTQQEQPVRAPDAFQLYGAEASDWLQKRQQYIGLAVGAVLVLGLIIALVSYFSGRKEESASRELGDALAVMEIPVVTGVDLQPAAEGQEKPFKSEAEKDEKIVESLNGFRAKYPGSNAAAMAALPMGKAEYRRGHYKEALAAFDEFLGKADKADPLTVSAREGQGYAHEALKDLDNALVSFQEMSKLDAGGFLQGMGQYHQARILAAQGKKDEAAKMLSDLKTAQTNTAAGRLATERLAVLVAQGAKVPEPTPAPAATPEAK